jgi:YD repeat-containing protein
LTRPNGINTNYGYDAVSHLLSVLHQQGNTTLDGASYTYDSAGNRQTKTNYLNGVTSNYGYDPLYQLTQVTQGGSTTESYSYDFVGNRLSSLGVPLYNYNSSNELTSNSNGSYTYDNNGNTLSDASGKSYTWDFENRLTQAIVPGQNGGTTAFKYDPFGRRIQKSSPLGTTNYLYDGPELLTRVITAAASLPNTRGLPISMSRCPSFALEQQVTMSRTELAQCRRLPPGKMRRSIDASGSTLTDPSGKQYTGISKIG